MKPMSNNFGRIGRFSASHPWATIVTWVIIAAVAITIGSNTTAFDPDNDFTIDVESQVAQNIENDAFGYEENGAQETIVLQSDQYLVTDPEFQAAAEGVIGRLTPFQDDILSIANYYEAPEDPQLQGLVSADQHALLIPISLQGEWNDYDGRWSDLETVLEQSQVDGFFIGAVGDISSGEINEIFNEDMAKDIQIGMPAAFVVMLIVFGALIAAGLPLILGVVTIVLSTGIVQILGGQMMMSDIAMTMVTMIGMAVGIDYSLVVVERYRQERKRGVKKLDAIEIASATAGKAVFFSGMTTVMALFGVFFVPMVEFQGMGLAMAVAVAVAVVAALTLLPTVITLVGDWINFPRFGTMRRLRAQDASGTPPVPMDEKHGLWGHIASFVVSRPGISATVVTIVLLAAALPALTIELGQPSWSKLPESSFVDSYTVMSDNFAAGQETPLKIVLSGDAANEGTVEEVQALFAGNDLYGTTKVLPNEDGSVIVIEAPLRVDNSSSEAHSAISSLRNDELQAIAGDNALVTGEPAFIYDFNNTLKDSLPKVFGFVLGLSFLVLMLAFRSLTVPTLSVVLNLLSVGAAYGAVVLVFQHGFLADQLGFVRVDSIVNWLPIMLFCILFGLSMDYHVFVLSRIREAWDRTRSVDESIVEGVNHTGHIITGAAVIMIAVFGSFALGRASEMQQMGFGLAIAVFLDVTLIRSILLPAGLKLLGERAWWWPRLLNWVPQIQVEGTPHPPIQVEPQTATQRNLGD